MRGLPEETPALADLVAVIPKTICIRSPKSFLWLRDWLFHMRLKTELVVRERFPVDIWWQKKSLPQFSFPPGRTPVSKREAEVPSCCLIFSGTCISEHLGLLSLPEFFFVFALHISYSQLSPCWRYHVNNLLRCCLGTSISRPKYQLKWSRVVYGVGLIPGSSDHVHIQNSLREVNVLQHKTFKGPEIQKNDQMTGSF